ncbi:MAG: hypothetical protein M1825_004274 [Sarcosagium campestre]|nr:MAG: hypothetical protein M1825_004274 [Sarcosagium campestre]
MESKQLDGANASLTIPVTEIVDGPFDEGTSGAVTNRGDSAAPSSKNGVAAGLEWSVRHRLINTEEAAGKRVDEEEEIHGEIESSWDTESEEGFDSGEDDDASCTPEESIHYRRQLHALGEEAFVQSTLGSGNVSVKKLCSAFGVQIPSIFQRAPAKVCYQLLALGLNRELRNRTKLQEYNTVDDAVQLLDKSKNIMVITGAGISTSLGIPDFRSKDTGLYSKLAGIGLSDPQEVFDIEIFREDPSIFYQIAKDILPSTDRYSPTHAFIRLLQDKGKLLTNFSQNIDNIEAAAGIHPDKLVQCHGSFATATCIRCKIQVPGSEIRNDLKAGRVPKCRVCCHHGTNSTMIGSQKRKHESNHGGQSKRRKASDWEDLDDEDEEVESHDADSVGVMKPDITFFGEDLPTRFHDRLVDHDRDLVDLVIVIGTSLKVAPVSEIVGFLPPQVPQICISRTVRLSLNPLSLLSPACPFIHPPILSADRVSYSKPISHVTFDIDLLGDCDVIVTELCRRARWNLEHEMIDKSLKIDVVPDEQQEARYTFSMASEEVESQNLL